MFGRNSRAGNVKCMLAAGLLVFGSEAVRELGTIVCQDFADFDGRGQFESKQEIDAALVRHVAIDVHENPARCAINGDKQVTAGSLIRHLRQVFDVNVDEARLVVLESFFWRNRFALGLGNDVFQARHAFALQETRDT